MTETNATPHFLSDLSDGEMLVYHATQTILESEGFPTIWILSLLTGIPKNRVLSHLISLQDKGLFPYCLVYPREFPSPELTETANAIDYLEMSEKDRGISDIRSIAERIGRSVEATEVLVSELTSRYGIV